MDAADLEPPVSQTLQEMIKGVLELGEEEQALLGMVEKPPAAASTAMLGLRPGGFDGLRLSGESLQFADFLPYLVGVPGQRNGGKHLLKALRSCSSISSNSSGSGRSGGADWTMA